jgi:bifunctional DNA-binding transcriptional regulator/antitoxin component of YhaV-PrlF toxin-antitoxin module
LTAPALPNNYLTVKITRSGQVTIPLAMRRKHGLRTDAEVELVDQPEGVLVVKAAVKSRGKRVLATLLRGGKVKGRTKDWLKLTRG